ncbi:MAG TPA: monovalent cation/H(+) antiporter subunit G [Actinocrinis sp.]|nr:monovalent cation/H(+) antiporter subunit G [Actinocrinis sp.]
MTWSGFQQTGSDVLVLVGAVLSLIAGIGLLRFPDLLSRMHAATKPQILGLLLVAVGTALRLGDANDVTSLIVVALFQTWTVPVAAHMVARVARRSGALDSSSLVVDEERPDPADA